MIELHRIGNTPLYTNLALVKLSMPVTLSDEVNNICLPLINEQTSSYYEYVKFGTWSGKIAKPSLNVTQWSINKRQLENKIQLTKWNNLGPCEVSIELKQGWLKEGLFL